MNTTRLGCISGSGFAVTLITLLVITGLGMARGGVLFSPGDLNAQTGIQPLGGVFSHADTGGRCSACHTAFWEQDTMKDRCRDCHTDIMDAQSFHTIMLAQSEILTCHHCHSDHQGPEGQITVMDLERFPHSEVGYALDAHQRTSDGTTFVCSDCHGNDISRFEVSSCLTCHQEIDPANMAAHELDFGTDCLDCHDGLETYGQAFDHNLTDFQLSGKHVEIACRDCHPGARTLVDLQTVQRACYDCHADNDVHVGRFGRDCAECHSSISWEGAQFDHSLASFPLTGAHIHVECAQCHLEGRFKGTSQDCVACHQADDAHQGRFGQDCHACHTTANWEAAEFDHSLSSFPLTGEHLNVECTQCHIEDAYQGTPQECVACHAEPNYHAGLFSMECAGCHDTNAWSPAKFDQSHTFPINHGVSGWNACSVCHPDRLSTYTCYGCHEHSAANIESEHREEGIANFENCMRCHPTGHEEEGGESREREEDD